jgi:hypothetical protein
MSFVLDPALLTLSGAAIERLPVGEETSRALETAVATSFVVGSTAVYLNAAPARPLWEAFGERSGRDFMWNSGLLDVDHERGGAFTHAVAALILATYPLWVRLGRKLARRAV